MKQVACSLTLAVVLSACGPRATVGPGEASGLAPVHESAQHLASLAPGQGDLLGRMAGRVVVVEFFATWCEPCRESIAPLTALRQHYPDDDLFIVGVSLDEESQVVQAYATEAGITYPIYLDPERGFAASLGVSQLPAAVVLDPQLQVKGRFAKVGAELFDRVAQEVRVGRGARTAP